MASFVASVKFQNACVINYCFAKVMSAALTTKNIYPSIMHHRSTSLPIVSIYTSKSHAISGEFSERTHDMKFQLLLQTMEVTNTPF